MALVTEVRRRPHVIAVSRTAGRGEAIFTRAQEKIAREVEAAGLHGREAAFALRTILFQLGGFIVVDFGIADDSSVHGVARWQGADPELRDELSHSIDIDEVFRFSLDAILARLLPTDSARRRASISRASVTLSWAAEVQAATGPPGVREGPAHEQVPHRLLRLPCRSPG